MTPFSRLRDAFTPSQPKALGPLFVGRDRYLSQMIGAVEDERVHVVLFGDRGRGKTSLANAVASLATEAGHLVLRQTCSSRTTFEDLFRAVFAAVPLQLLDPSARTGANSALSLLPDGPFGPAIAIEALRKIRTQHTLLVIDEFDRTTSDDVRTSLTEMIKGLSDVQAPVSLLLVGVSDSLEDLLGRHPSIERNVLGVHLVRMTDEEIRALVRTGAHAAGLGFADTVVRAIQRCSRGMPYYAHLLCLLSGRAATTRNAPQVEMSDFRDAAAYLCAKLRQEISPLLEAIERVNAAVGALLLWAAMAECDAHERFDVSAVMAAAGERADRLSETMVEDALEQLAAMRPAPIVAHASSVGPKLSFTHTWLPHLLLLQCELGSTGAKVEYVEHV